jgi:sn-glycerol 3-phosphate transport system ATP-binding protein
MNFLAAKVGADRKSVDLAATGGRPVILPLAVPTSAAPGTPVALGLRPEHLLPSSDGPLEFEIELAEPLGADTLLHGRYGAARELVTVRQGGHVTARPGEVHRYSVGATRLHLFDSQTGRRIADA